MSLQTYDYLLSFKLSEDFYIVKDLDDDGKPTFGIGFGQSVDDDGNITYEHNINVLGVENHEDNETNAASSTHRLEGNIENTVRFIRQVKSFFGLEIIITVAIIILRHKEKSYILNSVRVGADEKIQEWIDFLNDVLAGVILDGQHGGFSLITEDMIMQPVDDENDLTEDEEDAGIAQVSAGDFATVEYTNGTYVNVSDVFRLPVPDGYHHGADTGSGNDNWFYIVPENISLYDNHIDAKPFSFAVTTIPSGQIPFDVQKTEAYKQALVKVGVLSSDSAVDALIISSNCAFFYQTWTGMDDLYHKMNGVLFAGANVYQFHVFANYDEPIAAEEGALFKFTDMALSWMGKVSYIGDAPYRPVDMDSYKKHVADFINKACDLVNKASGVMGITMDFGSELRKHFVTMGGLLYQNHNIALSHDSAGRIAKMVGKIGGQELDAASAHEIVNHCGVTSGNIHDYIESYSATSVIKQLTKLDKMTNMDFYEGLSYFYLEAVDRFLQVLCLENNIAFSKSDSYISCKIGCRLIVENIWDSINIQVFGPGVFSATDITQPAEKLSEATETPATEGETDTTSKTPATALCQPPAEDWEIDDDGILVAYHGQETDIILPSSIRGIKLTDLSDTVKSITIPEGITEIGVCAFLECDQLEHVSIPESVTVLCTNAFGDCTGLRSITIPKNVTTIGDFAFSECTGLQEISLPDGLTTIEELAFWNCKELQRVEIPASVSAISHKAFWGCSGLKEVIIHEGVTSIDEQAFRDCSGLTSIVIPSSITEVGDAAFFGCSQLEYAVVTRGSCAERYFAEEGIECRYEDENLAPQKIKPIRRTEHFVIDEEGAFIEYMGAEEEVVLPGTVRTIKSCLIPDCVKRVVIPDGVTSIADYAFYGENNLKCITIPNSVTSIGNGAISRYGNLEYVVVDEGSCAEEYCLEAEIPYFYMHELGQRITPRIKTWSNPTIDEDGVLTRYDGNATDVTLPPSVTAIKGFAFHDTKELENLVLPESLKSIGDYTFYECGSLVSITIPNSVTSIGDSAFGSCSSLTRITIPDSVVSIGKHAFEKCTSLVNISIPNSVTSIGNKAFSGCSSLTSITIPNSVTSVGDIFGSCSSLVSITIPDSVTSIDDWAFCGCSSLASITIPDGTVSIGKYAFRGCSSLVSITIPDSVTSIDDWAFCGCSSLASITIPDSVTSIGYDAFGKCGSLRSIVWPGTVKEVPSSAFDGCGSLEEVTIHEGVSKIGYDAFSGCKQLRKVYLPRSLCYIARDAFSGLEDVKLYVYKDSYAETYAKAMKIAMEIVFTPEELAAEAERRRREAEEAERRRKEEEEAERQRIAALEEKQKRYDRLMASISEQNRIISENKGWFGAEAKARKAAQAQLKVLQEQLAREFPQGMP